MGIKKSRKNEMLVKSLEKRFNKAMCLAMGYTMEGHNDMDSFFNLEEMEKFKTLYEEYKNIIKDAKEWAREQDDMDHAMMCNMYQMQKTLDRINRKLDCIEIQD